MFRRHHTTQSKNLLSQIYATPGINKLTPICPALLDFSVGHLSRHPGYPNADFTRMTQGSRRCLTLDNPDQAGVPNHEYLDQVSMLHNMTSDDAIGLQCFWLPLAILLWKASLTNVCLDRTGISQGTSWTSTGHR